MSTWTEEELKRIAGTDDLHISPFLRGMELRDGTPTWIWSVVVENELYVRPYNGTSLTLVQSCGDAKRWSHHRGWYNEGCPLLTRWRVC